MATRRVDVRLDLNTAALVESARLVRGAVEANPIQEGEEVIAYLRRVIEAAHWTPEGWGD